VTAPRVQEAIKPSDRVSDVLARDESLVDVFVRHASHFEKLRSPMMRRVMAKLITVEQAARTAGVPADDLLRDLNLALGLPDPQGQTPAGLTPVVPGAGTHPEGRPTIELDVRDDMRTGREPFSRIMAAVGALDEARTLRLRTIFEPVPLFTVLARRGFQYESQRNAPDDWFAWFWRAAPESEGEAPHDTSSERERMTSPVEASEEHELDVRGLDPPQPMLRTLAALDDLPDGHTLVQINSRVPQLLFPVLHERGYACDLDESQPGRVIVRIRRRGRE
jgi:uncharacterized protein (DUF2249 family)